MLHLGLSLVVTGALALTTAACGEGVRGADRSVAPSPSDDARAALARGETVRAADDLVVARMEIEGGLAALGRNYAGHDVEDDTEQKLAAAEELWEQGDRKHAVSIMVNMLRVRLSLYAKSHPVAGNR